MAAQHTVTTISVTAKPAVVT